MKEVYITAEERKKCQKVADAFAELYEIENILVMDAGINFNITVNKEVLRMFLLLLTVRACLMICGKSGLIQS